MGRSDDAIAVAWREQTHAYVRAVNDFVARGRREGWEQVGAEPSDPRSPELAAEVLALVRRANAEGRWRELRTALPPDDMPLAPLVESKARPIRSVVWVDEETVLAAVGTTRDVEVHRISRDGSVARVPPLVAVGADPTNRVVAFASAYDVEVRPVEAALDTNAGAFPVFELPPGGSKDGPFVASVTPSSDGERILVVREDGVFVCSRSGTRRLFPLDDDAPQRLHATLAPSGEVVAIGALGAQHHLVDARTGAVIARFGPLHVGDPHHAAFSPDGAFVLFHAAQDTHGVCVAAPVDALVGLDLPPRVSSESFVVVNAGSRVDATSFHDGRFVVGDTQGYVRQRGIDGSEGWQLFVGSAVSALAWSPSGARLAVGTATGALCFFDGGEPSLPQIGDASLSDQLRVYFWRDELVRW